MGQPVLYATQRLFDEETRSEPSHRSKARKTESKLPIFLEFSQGKLGICGMYSEVGKQIENTELSMICRFVKFLVNEVKFLAVKTGWLVKCAKSNSNIRRLIYKCKHVCNVNIFHASCWCQFQRNSHFKRLYVSPKSNFSQFWRHLLTEPLPDILTDFLILFLKSRVDNLEEGYTIYAGVPYLHNGFLQWN